MCEPLYYDEDDQVITLYGVVHEAMLAGKPYAEVVSTAQAWVQEKGRKYIRTSVEEKDGQLYLVVRTCANSDEVGRKDCVVSNDVPVPAPFMAIAQARLREQLQ